MAHLGSILASQSAPRWVPTATKNDQKKMLKFYHFFDRFLSEKDALMTENPDPCQRLPVPPPKPPYLRLRPAQQLQSLLASSKALSVIRWRPQQSRPFPLTTPYLRLRPSLQLQTLLASSKALSVIRCPPQPSRPFPLTTPLS